MFNVRVSVHLLVGLLFLLLSSLSGAKLTVHLNAHTHDDVGWLKTVDQYYVGLNKTIDSSVVQYILSTVIDALEANPARKFMYVEQAFFQRFWNEQSDARKAVIRRLVADRQLEFVNGGWCMHDEATTHWVDMVDQTTLGHRFIVDEFGATANPTIGWQIDPFGHSATQAALLSAEAGLQAFFTARIDYQDFQQRYRTNTTEWIWRASPSTPDATVFAGIFQWADRQLYGPPTGFNYELYSNDPPIQNDPTLTDYNLDERVALFIQTALNQSAHNRGENLLWNMGFDFNFEEAHHCLRYKNLDILIAAVNAEGTVQAQYSTPSIYVAAKAKEALTWPLKTDDLFPYASRAHEWWTGFFTSRPALKRYVRVASALLQTFRQLELMVRGDGSATEELWQNVAVAQHHDGVSGTSKQHVAFDYAQRIAKGVAIAEASLYPRFAATITSPGGAIPALVSCPLANVSLCPITQAGAPVTIILHNPLGHARSERVFFPVASTGLQVVDSLGAVVPSDVLPTLSTPAVGEGAAAYHQSFIAQAPAVGFSTYHIGKSSQRHGRLHSARAAQPSTTEVACGAGGAAFNLSNGAVTLSFDASCALQSYAANGSAFAFSHRVGYYNGWQTSDPSLVLDCRGENSGAYLFRPQEPTAVFLSAINATVTALGNVVTDVRIAYGSWLTEIIRLTKGSDAVQFEYTVGGIPLDDGKGKEVIVTYSAPAWSEQAGVLYTDSNGREFQRRVKDFRQTWTLNVTDPVAGNYYPLNAAAYLNSSQGFFSLVTDRSQGVASLQPGTMEVMLHRRLLCDDNKGVQEELNETSAITHDNPGIRLGTPLVIIASHYVQFSRSLAPVRRLQSAVYSPLHAMLAPLTTSVSTYSATHTTSLSVVTGALPAQVDLSHAHPWVGAIPGNPWPDRNTTALLRFAHVHGVGEGADVAVPVTFDLAALFNQSHTHITNAVPVSLTANQPAANISAWHWTLDDGSDIGGTREAVKREGRELKAWRRSGEGGSQALTVTLQPMEVQTWIVRFS